MGWMTEGSEFQSLYCQDYFPGRKATLTSI
jgi:hypothetical protein